MVLRRRNKIIFFRSTHRYALIIAHIMRHYMHTCPNHVSHNSGHAAHSQLSQEAFHNGKDHGAENIGIRTIVDDCEWFYSSFRLVGGIRLGLFALDLFWSYFHDD